MFTETTAERGAGKQRREQRLRRPAQRAIRLTAAMASVGVITFVAYRLATVNATTVGFVFLVDVLVIATGWGLVEATVASLVATLCLNYFFLPPVGTFTIAEPENWVALIAFLLTAITASQLSARAERRTREAEERQREMERLYALSRAILLTDTSQAAAKQIARQIAQAFEFPAVALYHRNSGEIHAAGPENLPQIEAHLRNVALEGGWFRDPESGVIVAPIHLGGNPIGSLAVRGSSLSDTALNSLTNLVAIGLEKVRAQEAASRAEAARQSEEFKSTLLDAIAHDFKTPLTSIKAAATALLSDTVPKQPDQQELLSIMDEEADRLARLVTEAIQTARIESGKLQLNRELFPVGELIRTALQQTKPLAEGRRVNVRMPDSLPLVFVDRELVQFVLRQIIDNSVKYSAPAGPLTICAHVEGNFVVVSLADQGPGIPEEEQSRIFEKFYRSPHDHHRVTGTGMGLAIARDILRAHGGDISVKSVAGQGSEFSLTLPVAPQEEAS